MELAQVLINGILIGGLYGLIGLSASMNFGVMRIVNLSVGDITILAAYFCFFLISTGVVNSPLVALLIIIPSFFLLGFLIQKLIINKTLNKGILPPLLVTFGIAIIIQNLNLKLFSSDPRTIAAGNLSTQSIKIGDIYIPIIYTICLVVAILVLIIVRLILNRTDLGRNLRAVADDSSTAQIMGINPAWVYAVTGGLAFAVAAVAGVLYGITFTFEPSTGFFVLLIALEAAVIGKPGNLIGTLFGGIVLGLAQLLGATYIGANYGIVAEHTVFILVILIRSSPILLKKYKLNL